MGIADIIGFAAALICSLAMTPQVVKVYKSKETRDLSLGAFTALGTGLFLWLVYGLLISSVPVIFGNAVGLSLVLYVIIMKLIHG